MNILNGFVGKRFVAECNMGSANAKRRFINIDVRCALKCIHYVYFDSLFYSGLRKKKKKKMCQILLGGKGI